MSKADSRSRTVNTAVSSLRLLVRVPHPPQLHSQGALYMHPNGLASSHCSPNQVRVVQVLAVATELFRQLPCLIAVRRRAQ